MQAYTNLSCPQLAQLHTTEKKKLDDLSKQQISAANGDAFGVFLVGVPIGSVIGGDKEGEVAVSKGKVSAMESAALSKGCKLWVRGEGMRSGVAPAGAARRRHSQSRAFYRGRLEAGKAVDPEGAPTIA